MSDAFVAESLSSNSEKWCDMRAIGGEGKVSSVLLNVTDLRRAPAELGLRRAEGELGVFGDSVV